MMVRRKLVSHRVSSGPVQPGAEALELRRLLSTIVVNSAGDSDGADGSDTLSLRQAIEISNGTLAVASLTEAQVDLVVGALSTPNTIDFQIPGSGPVAIRPASTLPATTRAVVIDGYSEPGARPNTNGPGLSDNAALRIELDGSAFRAQGNLPTGLDLEAPGCTIQGLVIHGFADHAIKVSGATQDGDLIQGNFLGTDVTGLQRLGNAGPGIFALGDSSLTIGGVTPAARNIISGSTIGLELLGPSNLVEGNFIGTDSSGLAPIPNVIAGIFVSGAYNTIGGSTAGAGNLISGNTGLVGDGYGLELRGTGALVEGNLIGTDLTGTAAVPNASDGIRVDDGGNNTIGGTADGAGNVIAFNAGSGVGIAPPIHSVSAPYGVKISGNSILGNRGLGIDLGDDGVTPNTSARSPTGPNRFQPYPVLSSVTPDAGGTMISGTLDAAPSTVFTVELYSDATPDPSGFGQGQTYLGSTVATTDASGHVSFAFKTVLQVLLPYVTATATDPSGNTSEFSRDRSVEHSTKTTLIGPTSLATTGQPVTFAAVVAPTAAGVPTGVVAFGENGVLLGEAPLGASAIAVFVTNKLAPGLHAIVAVYLGDPGNAISLSNFASASVLPSLAMGGPTVNSVTASTTTTVKITFSRPLLIGPARDTANYGIIGPDGHPLSIESAVYDPATDTVTVTTLQPLKPGRSYRINVDGRRIGGVLDINGIALDGRRNGRPGSDFAGTVHLSRQVATNPHPSVPKSKAVGYKKGH